MSAPALATEFQLPWVDPDHATFHELLRRSEPGLVDLNREFRAHLMSRPFIGSLLRRVERDISALDAAPRLVEKQLLEFYGLLRLMVLLKWLAEPTGGYATREECLDEYFFRLGEPGAAWCYALRDAAPDWGELAAPRDMLGGSELARRYFASYLDEVLSTSLHARGAVLIRLERLEQLPFCDTLVTALAAWRHAGPVMIQGMLLRDRLVFRTLRQRHPGVTLRPEPRSSSEISELPRHLLGRVCSRLRDTGPRALRLTWRHRLDRPVDPGRALQFQRQLTLLKTRGIQASFTLELSQSSPDQLEPAAFSVMDALLRLRRDSARLDFHVVLESARRESPLQWIVRQRRASHFAELLRIQTEAERDGRGRPAIALDARLLASRGFAVSSRYRLEALAEICSASIEARRLRLGRKARVRPGTALSPSRDKRRFVLFPACPLVFAPESSGSFFWKVMRHFSRPRSVRTFLHQTPCDEADCLVYLDTLVHANALQIQ